MGSRGPSCHVYQRGMSNVSTSGMRIAGAVVLPVLAVGLLAGCGGKHSSASSSSHSSASHSSYSGSKSSSKSSKHSGMLSSKSCHPLSKNGNCYQAGQQCAKTQHGDKGKAGNGATIKCEDVKGTWRWES